MPSCQQAAVVCQHANMPTRSKSQSKQKAIFQMVLPTFAFGH